MWPTLELVRKWFPWCWWKFCHVFDESWTAKSEKEDCSLFWSSNTFHSQTGDKDWNATRFSLQWELHCLYKHQCTGPASKGFNLTLLNAAPSKTSKFNFELNHRWHFRKLRGNGFLIHLRVQTKWRAMKIRLIYLSPFSLDDLMMKCWKK